MTQYDANINAEIKRQIQIELQQNIDPMHTNNTIQTCLQERKELRSQEPWDPGDREGGLACDRKPNNDQSTFNFGVFHQFSLIIDSSEIG